MDTTEIASPLDKLGTRNDTQKNLRWQDSLPVQRLLDVVSSIIAEEHIQTAKQNPTVFTEIASPLDKLGAPAKKRWRAGAMTVVWIPPPEADKRFRGNDRCGGGNDRTFKPYYIAHTKIQTLALLDDEYKGSNWYHWRRG
jgi:hypothetical protein